MRAIRYSAAMSLDGYIADPHGRYDWIVMDPDIDFSQMFKEFDAVLMGRKSWEVARRQGDAGMATGMKTFVISRTLRQEDCPDATVSSDVARTVAELRRQPGKGIWLFGGGELFGSMLDLGLVDEVEVGVIPVLLGGGVPLLAMSAQRAKLTLIRHRVYEKSGTVLLSYQVERRQ